MIKIESAEHLKACFRTLDQDELMIPEEFKFPLGLKQTLTWIEPSGFRLYFVFEDPETRHPIGIVFHRNPGTPSPINMCDWCHSVRGGNEVGLLTVQASRNRRIGAHLCQNLDCIERVTDSPGVNDLPESLDRPERIARILARASHFARKYLF